MEFTGERFVPEVHGNIELEHLSCYLQACEFASGKIVLDIASGEGYGSAMLASKADKVIGVDISIEAVKHARTRYKNENLEFKVGTCNDIPLPDASVDFVVSFETIEHHDQHEEMMHEIKHVLRPGGMLLISTRINIIIPSSQIIKTHFTSKSYMSTSSKNSSGITLKMSPTSDNVLFMGQAYFQNCCRHRF